VNIPLNITHKDKRQAMKVLHIYDQSNALLTRYVSLLSQSLSDKVECQAAGTAKACQQAHKEFQPDVIHQHGKINYQIPSGGRLVVSPHGAPSLNLCKAYVVIAQSRMEANRQKAPRVEVVRNPLLTKTARFADIAKVTTDIYWRVMDSNPLEHLSESTRRALAILLKAGICCDRRWIDEEPCVDNWRHLYIYAHEEGVLPIVERGLKTLGKEIPAKPEVDIYLPEKYATPVSMEGRSIVEMVNDISKNGVSLLRLVNLDCALREDTLDETMLLEKIEQENIKPLFQSVLQLLAEQTLLTEGFMPCPALDNAETKRLRTQLENNLRL
jgi:hypothetical protein